MRGKGCGTAWGNAARAALESWTRTEYDDVARRVIVRSDLEAVGDGRRVAVQHFDQLGRVRLSRTLENAATEDPYNETHGIKVQTRYRFDNGADPANSNGTYTLTSNPYRAAYSNSATNEPTMGWTVEYEDKTGKTETTETFSGAALPAPWGGNTVSTGLARADEELNTTTSTDETGRKRRTVTDALGQLVRVDEPDAAGNLGAINAPVQPTNYSYDTLNNLTTVTQGAQTRTFAYSSLSRLLSAANPESGTFQFNYDSNGNLLTKTDARNISTTYTYDALNRVTFRNYSDVTPDITYTYDDPQVPFSRGKLTKVSSSVSETSTLGYDARERITASRQTTDGAAYDFGYAYNLADDLKTQTYPSGRIVSFDYDAGGELNIVTGQVGGVSKVHADSIGYAPHGQVESLRFGNGKWETAQFNSSLQITQIGLGHSAGDTGLWKVNYDYGEWEGPTLNTQRNNGNPARQTITVPTIGAVTGFTAVQWYAYDSLDRLLSATETVNGGETWRQTFTYDRFGNRRFDTSQTSIPNSTENQDIVNPSLDAANNRTSSAGYSHDLAGNMTASANGLTYAYDAENKQAAVNDSGGLAATYAYDPDGRRVKKFTAANGETVVFVYDAFGKLSAEYSTQVPAQNPRTSYLTSDALGSVRVITDQNGEVVSRRDFLPFGVELTAGIGPRNTTQKYGFGDGVRQKFTTYKRDDESGLDYAESRYYSPKWGRFTSPDEFKGGPDELFDFEEDASDNPTFYADLTNPQSLNKYQYAYNNPYKLTDPTGHCPPCLFRSLQQAKETIDTALDVAQTALSVVGIIPVVGDVADLGNAAISASRGNTTDAVVDLLSAATGPIGNAVSVVNRARKLAKVGSRAENAVDLVKPTTRGRQNEARVLKSEGLTKNTKKVSSKEGNSIPDAITKKAFVEVKDRRRVSNTKQIRIQRQAAIDSNRKHIVVTGKHTKVSRNVEQGPTKVKRRDDIGPQQ